MDKMLFIENVLCVKNLHLASSDIFDENFYKGRLIYIYNQMMIYLGTEERAVSEIRFF